MMNRSKGYQILLILLIGMVILYFITDQMIVVLFAIIIVIVGVAFLEKNKGLSSVNETDTI